MSVYPRLMWAQDGTEITVCDEAEQLQKEADGYSSIYDPAHAPVTAPIEAINPLIEDEPASETPTFGAADDGTGDEPTEGPSDDDSHTKRGKKKK